MLTPLEYFVRPASRGSVLLIAATLATLILANSPLRDFWFRLWNHPLDIGGMDHTLREWVNDALMAIFFLHVGLELKREVLVGELASLRDAALPLIAAAGGMAVPAAIYLAINPAPPASHGWGVPMATDIAFAVGILMMLGERVPRGLIVFLTALAIADDLGAVLAIAIAYTHEIDFLALASAGGVLAALGILNVTGVRTVFPYCVLGVALWIMMANSGVHATIAGVLLALAIPARPACTPQQFDERVRGILDDFRALAEDRNTPSDTLASHDMATMLIALERDARAVQSPLHRTGIALGPWVTYLILPVFALANAALELDGMVGNLAKPIALGILAGLVLGKFIGIAGTTLLAVWLGVGRLPSGVTARHVFGGAWLGGIGFTMSIFISQLAFDPEQAEVAKGSILMASLVSAVIGALWLAVANRRTVGTAAAST
jgi:NhaA family Na+:H+ antiporter